MSARPSRYERGTSSLSSVPVLSPSTRSNTSRARATQSSLLRVCTASMLSRKLRSTNVGAWSTCFAILPPTSGSGFSDTCQPRRAPFGRSSKVPHEGERTWKRSGSCHAGIPAATQCAWQLSPLDVLWVGFAEVCRDGASLARLELAPPDACARLWRHPSNYHIT